MMLSFRLRATAILYYDIFYHWIRHCMAAKFVAYRVVDQKEKEKPAGNSRITKASDDASITTDRNVATITVHL